MRSSSGDSRRRVCLRAGIDGQVVESQLATGDQVGPCHCAFVWRYLVCRRDPVCTDLEMRCFTSLSIAEQGPVEARLLFLDISAEFDG